MALTEDVRIVGSLGAAQATVQINQPCLANVTVQLVGSPTLTVVFEVNDDEGASPTWVAVNAINLNTGASVASATGAGIYRVDVAGVRFFRVRCSAYTSGSFAVTLNGSVAPGSGAGSAGTSTVAGTVTANQGTQGAGGTASWPVQGAAAAGAALAGNPVLMGGSDGSNAQNLLVQAAATPNLRIIPYSGSTVLVGGFGDGTGIGTAAYGAAATMAFNGTNFDRMRGNVDVTLLASAAHTTTQTSADIVTYNAHSIIVTLDMTVVGTGSVTLAINYKDPASGKYIALLTGAAVVGNSTNVYTINPNIPAVANVTAQKDLGRTIQIVVTANNANTATYSVGYTLVC